MPSHSKVPSRPHTLTDNEPLHAVLELGRAAQLFGCVLQSILPLRQLGPQCRDLTPQLLLLGQDRCNEL